MSLPESIAGWRRRAPLPRGTPRRDAEALAIWHESSTAFLPRLADAGVAASHGRAEWRQAVRGAHTAFLRQHLVELFEAVSLTDLTVLGGPGFTLFPSLDASPPELREDGQRSLREKIGFEYKTAIFLSELLAHPQLGERLLERARQPLPEALRRLAVFQETGRADLGGARIERQGNLAFVELSSPAALNAEDDAVLSALEVCVDLALLDPRVEVGVLRGAPVQNSKYLGRRVFCSGLNLFSLYEGHLPFLYFVRRELGLLSKLYRGLQLGEGPREIEKPWVAAVETHAIGGGCQLLLVVDRVLVERGASLSLPAKKEGIIPGAANLRLARFLGERMAREVLFMDRALRADLDEGRSLVDELVEPGEMLPAIRSSAAALASSGAVSAASHRKALRIAQEPIQLFREYMAHFAIAQADCYFDPALPSNLERHWLSGSRRRQAASAGVAGDADA